MRTGTRTRVARMRTVLGRFRRADAGIAAVEFAFILPLLLIFYMYLVEFSRAFEEKRKVDRLASTLSDLVSQQPTGSPIPPSAIGSILNASASLITPFGGSTLAVTASVIELTAKTDKTCCDARVKWTFTQGGALRPCGTVLSQVAASVPPQPGNILSAAVTSQTTSSTGVGELVVTDVHADFTPIFNGLVKLFSGGFQHTTYVVPRATGQLTLQSAGVSQKGQQAQICS